jgi:beta-fructofuranosidase
LPPPKELLADDTGRLVLKTYYRWERMVERKLQQEAFCMPKKLLENTTASITVEGSTWTCTARSGYELFVFEKPSSNFIWEGVLSADGTGKFGLVSDMDSKGNGYFISFDIANGLVKIRCWGFNPVNSKQNFIFSDIQSGVFDIKDKPSFHFRLIRYGNYIELAIDDKVKLTLMDYTFSGNNIGVYSCSSVIKLHHSVLKILPDHFGEYASQEEAQKLS